MSNDTKYRVFKNRILLLGFGSIGQGILPLLLRHIDMKPEQITIITTDDSGRDAALKQGVELIADTVTSENYLTLLGARLSEGDFLINLSYETSTVDLIEMCQSKDVLYIDTCIEPWPGDYTDPKLTPSERSNYFLRYNALERRSQYPNGSTAIVTHGANPGLVSHFVKQALVNIARDSNPQAAIPKTRTEWGELARDLGIKVIHVSERDSQVGKEPKKPGEFVNTWSIDAFFGEGTQPSELGWGTHEKQMPPDSGRHSFGSNAAIFLDRPGYSTRVRSWTPLEGPYQGFLITHSESISIADYLTLSNEHGQPVYRPTCHYAYHPCDDAVLSLHELAGKNGQLQTQKRVMTDEIISGIDELGVLLMGNKKGTYWYGSRLSIDEARRRVPYNNATSLQVTSAMLGAVIWALENPRRGIVEPDEMNFDRILEIANPYLGEVVGVWSDWTPLSGRTALFPEDIDSSDPWQFKNVRVA